MNGKTRRGWLIVAPLALAGAVGGTGPLKLGTSAARSGAGSPSGETFVANRGRYSQPTPHEELAAPAVKHSLQTGLSVAVDQRVDPDMFMT